MVVLVQHAQLRWRPVLRHARAPHRAGGECAGIGELLLRQPGVGIRPRAAVTELGARGDAAVRRLRAAASVCGAQAHAARSLRPEPGHGVPAAAQVAESKRSGTAATGGRQVPRRLLLPVGLRMVGNERKMGLGRRRARYARDSYSSRFPFLTSAVATNNAGVLPSGPSDAGNRRPKMELSLTRYWAFGTMATDRVVQFPGPHAPFLPRLSPPRVSSAFEDGSFTNRNWVRRCP